jgi:hypothetical protein
MRDYYECKILYQIKGKSITSIGGNSTRDLEFRRSNIHNCNPTAISSVDGNNYDTTRKLVTSDSITGCRHSIMYCTCKKPEYHVAIESLYYLTNADIAFLVEVADIIALVTYYPNDSGTIKCDEESYQKVPGLDDDMVQVTYAEVKVPSRGERRIPRLNRDLSKFYKPGSMMYDDYCVSWDCQIFTDYVIIHFMKAIRDDDTEVCDPHTKFEATMLLRCKDTYVSINKYCATLMEKTSISPSIECDCDVKVVMYSGESFYIIDNHVKCYELLTPDELNNIDDIPIMDFKEMYLQVFSDNDGKLQSEM